MKTNPPAGESGTTITASDPYTSNPRCTEEDQRPSALPQSSSPGLSSVLQKAEVLSQEEWEALHRSTIRDETLVITVSEIATALDVNPYESAFTLYHRKRGELPPFTGNISTRAGHILEPLVDALYTENTGRKTVDPGAYAIHRHEDLPWLICTVDRLDEELRAVELKATGSHTRKDFKDGKGPLGYQVQNQAQLAVVGLEHGSIAALVANREFFCHDFDRHDRFIRGMLDKIREFRDRCLNGDPPDPGGSLSTTETLKLLHPKDNGETVYNDRLAPYIKEQEKLKQNQKQLKEHLALVENRIKAALGDNSYLVAEGQKKSYLWQKKKGQYVKKSEYRVLR